MPKAKRSPQEIQHLKNYGEYCIVSSVILITSPLNFNDPLERFRKSTKHLQLTLATVHLFSMLIVGGFVVWGMVSNTVALRNMASLCLIFSFTFGFLTLASSWRHHKADLVLSIILTLVYLGGKIYSLL